MHSSNRDDVLIFDGSCGVSLQAMDLPASAWGGYEGCTEYLNLSAASAMVELHNSFLEAGSGVIETNTLGGTSIVLSEYGLQDRVAEINRAAVRVAREAIGSRAGCRVAASIGPTTKLPSLNQITVDEMYAAYLEQMRVMAEERVDFLLIETCQDLLQIKTALTAARDAMEQEGIEIPIMVSVTVETTGTMLIGADIAAAAAALEPFNLYSLGLNCATGPSRMRPHVHYLCRNFPGKVSVMPNAGMPQVQQGQTCYPLSPDEYAEAMARYVVEDGVEIVGGCCGTTPEHIRRLVAELEGRKPAPRTIEPPALIASGYQAVELDQPLGPLLIGERANTTGSKAFRELLLADDYQGCLRVGMKQENGGAHAVDLSVAYAGRDELKDMETLIAMFAESVKVPTVIDSTTPAVIEAALKRHPGRCVINSINLEDGGRRLEEICRLAKRYGAAVIALTINENGMALTEEDKVETARRIHELAVGEYGLRPQDILFDMLTFTIGSGDENLRDAAVQTMNAIHRVKQELPGVFTVLGVSNISFGLPKASRPVLNSVFLHEAVEEGLDAAIVDPAKVIPLPKISATDREICLNLIYNRPVDDVDALTAYINHFSDRSERDDREEEKGYRPPEQVLTEKVVNGDRDGLEDLLSIMLERRKPTAIINEILVPAMRTVGELFGRGEMLLPFVLQSAEVMKQSVDILEPHMDKTEDGKGGSKVLLATVEGDVHDIGKNLVDIILSNNGFRVYNIGIKASAGSIIEKAREYDVDVIGLSGLLVKSAMVMTEDLPLFEEAGLDAPVLLGGAALTEEFVATDCVPKYHAPVVYCADAFAGLQAMQEFDAGKLRPTVHRKSRRSVRPAPADQPPVDRSNEVPEPPFLGAKHIDVKVSDILPYVNVQALFRGRWGYRRQNMSTAEYRTLIEETVQPMYDDLCRRSMEGNLLTPKVAYGYFPGWSEGNTVVVDNHGTQYRFDFPRQKDQPHRCIADFYKTRDEGGDIVPFFVVTVGPTIHQETQKLFADDRYHDYLIMHAFGVEVADALAEFWHEKMREEMNISENRPDDLSGYFIQQYQGSRYGFGYPACPDLAQQELVFALLEPEKIGVELTENHQMIPEESTSAIIAHHPQAKYFAM
ncbi:MAG: methionine synthase [Phycisphaerae bacterium]